MQNYDTWPSTWWCPWRFIDFTQNAGVEQRLSISKWPQKEVDTLMLQKCGSQGDMVEDPIFETTLNI